MGEKKKKKNVAVDLDGVLAQYDGWKGRDHIGHPIKGAREFLLDLRERGYRVVVYTTRCNVSMNSDVVPSEYGETTIAGSLRKLVESWLAKWGMPYDEVYVGQGKPHATAFVDDRAVSCQPQDHGDAAFLQALRELDGLDGMYDTKDTKDVVAESGTES